MYLKCVASAPSAAASARTLETLILKSVFCAVLRSPDILLEFSAFDTFVSCVVVASSAAALALAN